MGSKQEYQVFFSLSSKQNSSNEYLLSAYYVRGIFLFQENKWQGPHRDSEWEDNQIRQI